MDYRITITNELYVKLMQDMNYFGFNKLNTFLTTVIQNTNEYLLNIKKLDSIKDIIKNYFLKYYKTSNTDQFNLFLSDSALAIQQSLLLRKNTSSKNKNIIIKSTKANDDYIYTLVNQARNINNATILRNIILEYISLPQYTREKILFNKNYEKLIKCKKDSIKCIIKTGRGKFIADVIDIVPGKEEFHSFVVCKVKKFDDEKESPINTLNIMSTKLCSISSVIILNESFYLDEFERQEIAAKIEKFGPTFLNEDSSLIKVKFDDEGKNLYKKLYKDRPLLIETKEDDTYVFDSTAFQICLYLKGFGKHATIIADSQISELALLELANFYKDACDCYMQLEKQLSKKMSEEN